MTNVRKCQAKTLVAENADRFFERYPDKDDKYGNIGVSFVSLIGRAGDMPFWVKGS